MRFRDQTRLPGRRMAVALGALTLGLGIAAASGSASRAQERAQSGSFEQVNEVVANLASGQVTVIAAHDGVVVATVGNQFEPDDLEPMIVPMGERNVAVLLGAVDWVRPPRNQTVFQLAAQLPQLTNALGSKAPRLSSNTNLQNLDAVGIQILEPLRAAAHNLHAHIKLPDNLPLAEVVLVHQPYQNSPSVVDLSYWIRQTFLQENFWDTEVERPRITQIYPVKGDRSGLIDIRYPINDRSPGLLDWLDHPGGRLARAIEADPKIAKAQRDIAAGKGEKAHLNELVPLVKTALETMAPGEGHAMAVIDWDHGFSWVIEPPKKAQPKPQRPKGAPTLRSNPHSETMHRIRGMDSSHSANSLL